MKTIVTELTAVWKDTRLIVLTAQIAAIYAAILIPFKVGIPLIPGFAELRPANAIPIVTSLLFGPPAAWGSAIGNIIGDCFGTLGPASVFGFLGNFVYGYVPYRMWGNLKLLSSGQEPIICSWRQGLEYGIICLTASAICAGVIAWGVELLGLLPFSILAPAIFFNNIVMGLLLGPPLLRFLYPRVKRWRLRFDDLRQPTTFSIPSTCQRHDTDQEIAPMAAPSFQDLTTTHVVVLDRLTFQYPDTSHPALQDVSMTINRGEMIALMGRSGSGKSTLCYTLNGLIPQCVAGEFSGSVHVNGSDTRTQPVWKQADSVGLVFQDFETQLISTSVEMELASALARTQHTLSKEARQDQIHHTLEQVGLAGLNRKDPLTLSGGQRQRLVIASMLVRNPSLLVLDQPMTDLDPAGRQDILTLLHKLKQEGRTIVLAEHNPEDVLMADRLIIFDQGRLQWEGTPTALCTNVALMEHYGLQPPPITECFSQQGFFTLPTTVEQAWKFLEAHHLTLEAPPNVSPDVSPDGKQPAPASVKTSNLLMQFDKVGFTYPNATSALHDIAFSVSTGEYIAIVGRNGSGKSTLAQLMNGLLLPTEGQVRIDGRDTRTTPISELAGRVGYVFQNPDHQIFAPSVWDEVAFGARNIGCSPEECADRVAHALKAVALDEPHAHTVDPFSLTKGARQRVAVASILAAKPNILIFDEPNTGLDPEETRRMMAMIHQLNRLGHTIVLITHTMELVASYAARCLVMREGRLIADGPTREIFADKPLLASASLTMPAIPRFSQHCGQTLLTVPEVRACLKPREGGA